jgi:hypothetical protein
MSCKENITLQRKDKIQFSLWARSLLHSEMWRRVSWYIFTNIPEEPSTFISRVEERFHTYTLKIFFVIIILVCEAISHCGHSWPIVPDSGDSEDDCRKADGM